MDMMSLVIFEILFFVCFFGIFGSVIFSMIKGVKRVKDTVSVVRDIDRSSSESSKYQTINSHYSPETLQPAYNGTFRTDYTANDHNHAYEHKVEPIEEASVHSLVQERKQDYIERKAERKADLPKTSYSKVEEKLKKNNSSKYRDVQGVFAKNGDNDAMVAGNETVMTCEYCGAKNILPRSRSVAYKCYFCRQEL